MKQKQDMAIKEVEPLPKIDALDVPLRYNNDRNKYCIMKIQRRTHLQYDGKWTCSVVYFVVALLLINHLCVLVLALPPLHFSNALGNSMVLSKNGSVIWGYSPIENDELDIFLSEKMLGTTVANVTVPFSQKENVYEWKFYIPICN